MKTIKVTVKNKRTGQTKTVGKKPSPNYKRPGRLA
jgi:hypothetical protein